MKLILACLLALFLHPHSANCGEPPMYKTGEELLAAVNSEMKTIGRAPFTLDELTVWLVEQARFERIDRDKRQENGIQTFLQDLIAKKPFRDPIDIFMTPIDKVELNENADSAVSVTPYYVLEVRILTIPWGSVDKDGNRQKVNWHAIPIATFLVNK